LKNKAPKAPKSVFSIELREGLDYWVETDRKVVLRVFDIVESVMLNPFEGIGKPEPICYLSNGVWSRRVTQEHRIVYVVSEGRIDFIQCRYHY
jgi:toxin YoeB